MVRRKPKRPTRSPSPYGILPPDNVSEIVSDHHAPPKKKLKEVRLERIDSLFESYADRSSGFIEEAGIETLCKDLHVDSNDVKMLMFAWKMKAKKPGFISKDEWRTGLKLLGADTIPELRKEIDVIEIQKMVPEGFENFYSYVFRYNLRHYYQLALNIETACELLDIALRVVFLTKVDSLIEFLKIQKVYNGIRLEEWQSFYRFFKEVNTEDLQGYDNFESESWPAIIDNFVEWLKEKQQKVPSPSQNTP